MRAGGAWLLTFADLAALLLALFVLAFSMTVPDPPRLHALGLTMAGRSALPTRPDGPPRLSAPGPEAAGDVAANYLVRVLDDSFARLGRPCRAEAGVIGSFARIRFAAGLLDGDAACAALAVPIRAVLPRLLVATGGEPASLVLPASDGAATRPPVAQLARGQRRAQELFGIAMHVLVPAASDAGDVAVLRVGPL